MTSAQSASRPQPFHFSLKVQASRFRESLPPDLSKVKVRNQRNQGRALDPKGAFAPMISPYSNLLVMYTRDLAPKARQTCPTNLPMERSRKRDLLLNLSYRLHLSARSYAWKLVTA